MKKLDLAAALFAIAAAFSAGTALAGDPAKEIITKSDSDGMVVFVKPQKMERDKGSSALKDMEYDITLSTFNDSVSVTASVITRQPFETDSVAVFYGTEPIHAKIHRIYVEPAKGSWVSRLRFYITTGQLQQLIEAANGISIDWDSQDGSISFRHSRKEWNKRREALRLSINILQQNITK